MLMFTGVGALIEGTQALVYNEFDKRTGNVKIVMAGKKIRLWSEVFPNAYIVAIFACSRTVYDGFRFVPVITEKS